MQQFRDRVDAGKQLATALHSYADAPDTMVLGLPRGGVVPAYEVARALSLPLDVIVTRKIGAPGQPELAVGAVDAQGHTYMNGQLMSRIGITREDVARTIEQERAEAQRRQQLFRVGKPPLQLKGKQVILVDDGLATGATMRAAIASVRAAGASKVVVALPVAPADCRQEMTDLVDDVVIVHEPAFFGAVGMFYRDFKQVEDDQVLAVLQYTH